MKKLVLVGIGNFSDVARAYFEKFSEYEVVAYACDSDYESRDFYQELPVVDLNKIESTYSPYEVSVFVAVGYSKVNSIRKRIYQDLKNKNYSFASFIHPNVNIWDSTIVGDNVFIFEDNTIQPFTTIGDNTTLWSGNHLGHHSKIGKHCFISSHVVISGDCSIGEQVFIGVNATLRDGIRVANRTIIGAGALVMKDTKEEDVFVVKGTQPSRIKSSQLSF